jgi:hypothetical protein
VLGIELVVARNGYGYFDDYNGYHVNPDTGQATVNFGTSASAEPTPLPSGQAGQFGDTGNGWYSYNLGAWHIISLNAECALPAHGNCDPNAPWYRSETQWLSQDLNRDHAACTMAYWHQPRFSAGDPSSSGPGGDPEGPAADVWWKLLYAHHADLILNGHDDLYARFASMDPAGNADPQNGIREFIIGTGGESLDTLRRSAPNLQAGADEYYGVMKLTLKANGYAWDYQSALESPSAPAGTPPTYLRFDAVAGTGSVPASAVAQGRRGDRRATPARPVRGESSPCAHAGWGRCSATPVRTSAIPATSSSDGIWARTTIPITVAIAGSSATIVA